MRCVCVDVCLWAGVGALCRDVFGQCVGMCVCVCVTALVDTTSPFKAKVRYQQKALDLRKKLNVGIELKILGLKVMTVISLP